MAPAAAWARRLRAYDGAHLALLAGLLGLLGIFIAYPVVRVVYVAVADPTAGWTLVHLRAFFQRPLFMEALTNSLLAGLVAVLGGTVLSLPLAYLLVRYDFPGRSLVQTLSVLPLVVPPFVGAISLQQVLGRTGMVNLLLLRWFGTTVPFMEGLAGVMLVQTLHYFPFILVNTAAALGRVDRSLEEMGQNLGCHGLRLFRRITFPLVMPGYIAGAVLVFIKVVDDLGTPLMLNFTKMLAPQAYLRVTTIGLEDVSGYVICLILVGISVTALAAAMKVLSLREYASIQRGPAAEEAQQRLRGWRLAGGWALVAFVLGVALIPHVGIFLLSFARRWSFSVLPAAYTLSHYGEILFRAPHFMKNTLAYGVLAAAMDVLLGALIAYLLLRGRIPGRGLLDALAVLPLAIPGVVLGIGYLRAFHGVTLPGGASLTGSWVILVIAYAVRRLPYTVRACYAAMQQIHVALEEAAMNLGAPRTRTFLRVTVPLMAGGMLGGGILAFVTSAVELSATMVLVNRMEQGPLAYGIYVYMQSALGRGPGAAMGVVTILMVGLGTYLANRLFGGRGQAMFRL